MNEYSRWELICKKSPRALGFETTRMELVEIIDTLDPENEGIVTWDSFVRLCALKMKCRNPPYEIKNG